MRGIEGADEHIGRILPHLVEQGIHRGVRGGLVVDLNLEMCTIVTHLVHAHKQAAVELHAALVLGVLSQQGQQHCHLDGRHAAVGGHWCLSPHRDAEQLAFLQFAVACHHPAVSPPEFIHTDAIFLGNAAQGFLALHGVGHVFHLGSGRLRHHVAVLRHLGHGYANDLPRFDAVGVETGIARHHLLHAHPIVLGYVVQCFAGHHRVAHRLRRVLRPQRTRRCAQPAQQQDETHGHKA